MKLPPPSPALWLQENLLAELQADLSLSAQFTRARDVLHVAELGTEGSQDSNEHLILASGSNCNPVSAGQVLPSVRAMWRHTNATALTLCSSETQPRALVFVAKSPAVLGAR